MDNVQSKPNNILRKVRAFAARALIILGSIPYILIVLAGIRGLFPGQFLGQELSGGISSASSMIVFVGWVLSLSLVPAIIMIVVGIILLPKADSIK